MRHPEIKSKILGSCLMEKTGTKAAAPDIAVFLDENLPKYQEGDSRKINLDRDQAPKIVIEVADTTLDSDLDQKKHLYADLGIPEYWVVDAKSAQVFIFVLQGEQYVRFEQSQLSQAIEQMQAGSNILVVSWFNTQLSLYSEESK